MFVHPPQSKAVLMFIICRYENNKKIIQVSTIEVELFNVDQQCTQQILIVALVHPTQHFLEVERFLISHKWFEHFASHLAEDVATSSRNVDLSQQLQSSYVLPVGLEVFVQEVGIFTQALRQCKSTDLNWSYMREGSISSGLAKNLANRPRCMSFFSLLPVFQMYSLSIMMRLVNRAQQRRCYSSQNLSPIQSLSLLSLHMFMQFCRLVMYRVNQHSALWSPSPRQYYFFISRQKPYKKMSTQRYSRKHLKRIQRVKGLSTSFSASLVLLVMSPILERFLRCPRTELQKLDFSSFSFLRKKSLLRNSQKEILFLQSQESSWRMIWLISLLGTNSSISASIFSCLWYLILIYLSVKKRSQILPIFHISQLYESKWYLNSSGLQTSYPFSDYCQFRSQIACLSPHFYPRFTTQEGLIWQGITRLRRRCIRAYIIAFIAFSDYYPRSAQGRISYRDWSFF